MQDLAAALSPRPVLIVCMVRMMKQCPSGRTPAPGHTDHPRLAELLLLVPAQTAEKPVVIDIHLHYAMCQEEYWVPQDGGLYGSVHQREIHSDIYEETIDTQKYFLAHMQDCYMVHQLFDEPL